ncbi:MULTISPECIES: hypothetical protein [unclassified Pseudomonas]|uniref:hypothetical protein n=1 Tax=unclassified Pseudomonas TaxID=196821 RepID=UPI001F5777D9|nr:MULTISPECIES: hypothetical protein [unclassified Pseudomonas]
MTKDRTCDDSSEDSKTLTLYPPYIPAMIKPIDGDEGYDGGIGVEGLKSDLLITVDPWLGNALDQKCLLYWNDPTSHVLSEIVDTPEKLTEPLRFHLPASQILDGRAFPVFYRIVPPSGNDSDSLKLNVLIKRTLPGGVLDNPEPLGHPGLRYSLSPDITGGVDGEMAKQGITMLVEPYENMTIFDRIVAKLGDEQVIHYPVTAEQISDSRNHPITLMFDEQLIRRAGNGKHAITYQVIDRCGNRPHVHAPWAIATTALVNLDQIPAPTVSGEQDGILDPAFITSIQAEASGMGLIAGDDVRVRWQGRVERVTAAQRFTASALQFAIPLMWANESDQSTITITLIVTRAGADLTSDPKTLVINTTIRLRPPKVLEAYGELGDRLKMSDIYYARHVTIRVESYTGMAIGQTLRARWASARNTYDSAITPVTTVGAMDFTVPRLEVVDAIGSDVLVDFTVRTYIDGPLHRAEPLQLKVDAQPFELPPPRISSDRTMVTVRYPAMTTGYQARVRWGGTITRRTAWKNMHPDTTAEFSIPADWLEENKDTTVLINYSVHQTGSNEQSQFSQVLRLEL